MAGAPMKIQSRYAYDPESDLLGSGGFARVFRARDELLQRDVALKVFNLTGSHDYTVLNEIRKVIQLAHPNLMRYFDVILLEQSNALGEKEQLQIGVMEYANAGDLKQFARANPGSAQLEDLLAEVLHGLAYLHAKGIVHRGLKAQNILLVHQGERLTAKLADFGVSKDLGQAGKSSSVMVGTIEYMAPEQFSPQRYGIDGKIGPSLDLWSFGVMVHELLTGRTPFGGRDGAMTTEQIMRAILSSELPAGVEQLPEPYRSVIERCLVADAKDRIRSANELLRYFDGGASPAAAVAPAAEVRDEDATRLLAKDLVPSPLAAAPPPAEDEATRSPSPRAERRAKRLLPATGVFVLLLAVGLAWWHAAHRDDGLDERVATPPPEPSRPVPAPAPTITPALATEPAAAPVAPDNEIGESNYRDVPLEQLLGAIKATKDKERKKTLKFFARSRLSGEFDFGSAAGLVNSQPAVLRFTSYDPAKNLLEMRVKVSGKEGDTPCKGSPCAQASRVIVSVGALDRIEFRGTADYFELDCWASTGMRGRTGGCIDIRRLEGNCEADSPSSGACGAFDAFRLGFGYGRAGSDDRKRVNAFKNALRRIVYEIDGRPAL